MVYERNPWQDRFNTPDYKALKRDLSPESTAILDDARETMLSYDSVSERVTWYGPTWCWALEYILPKHDKPLALLIAMPDDIQLAMPLDKEFLKALPLRRLRRSVRDGLELALEPYETEWSVWPIQPDGLIDDLNDIIKRRHAHLTERKLSMAK